MRAYAAQRGQITPVVPDSVAVLINARRGHVCAASDRTIAAAGSGRIPTAPRSSTWAHWGGDAADDVLGGQYRCHLPPAS